MVEYQPGLQLHSEPKAHAENLSGRWVSPIMYDHGQKKYSRDDLSGKSASTGEADRRNADRHVFTASAEVVELSSGARFSTRTTDLGPGGCFVDTMLPFPVGAKVRVNVQKGKTQFETGGVVVYSQTGLGMASRSTRSSRSSARRSTPGSAS